MELAFFDIVGTDEKDLQNYVRVSTFAEKHISMETRNQVTRLQISVKHSKPVEINSFTASLNAVNSLYCSFVQKHGGCDEQAQAKLYVEKIEEGSIIVSLIELVSATLLPFMENVNTIVDFAKYVKSTLAYFIHGEGEKTPLTISECRDFNNVLGMVANDNKGNMSIEAIGNNNNVFVGCNISFTDSNAGQNRFSKEMEALKSAEPARRVYSRQLMTIFQMRSDMTKDTGNKATIESISRSRLPIVFETDELKESILHADSNPVKKAFLVDVEVQTVNDKIAAYKILALHDTIDLED